MNISSRINKIHSIYGKAKYAFLAVFVLVVMFSSFVSARVYGDSVVGTVETRITLNIDGKTKNIVTTQNTIAGALVQNGIMLGKNDITEPGVDTYLSGAHLDVSVVRAVPVLITDNSQSWPATSAYTSPTDILKQLAVEIFPEDIVTAELILDPIAEGTAGQRVVIKRAPVYSIYVDDLTKVVRSWVKTVGDLLSEKGIVLGPNDIVEPSKDTPLSGVKEITVTRINYADIEETVAIPFEVVEQKDYNQYQGKSTVTQAGQDGTKVQKVHVVYKNGAEVERTVTSSEMTVAPQNKIIKVGVKPYGMDDYWPILVSAGTKYGVDPNKMARVMLCESGGRQFADNGTNKGIFQWDGSLYTWAAKAGHPASNMFDIDAQIYATALRASKNGWAAWGQCQFR